LPLPHPVGLAHFSFRFNREFAYNSGGLPHADMRPRHGRGIVLFRLDSTGPSPGAGGPPSSPLTTPGDAVTIDVPPANDEETLPIIKEYRADRFRTLARLGIQAARALAWTHRKGFLHRDIKPSNIMVDQHGQLYLLDFGLTALWSPGQRPSWGACSARLTS